MADKLIVTLRRSIIGEEMGNRIGVVPQQRPALLGDLPVPALQLHDVAIREPLERAIVGRANALVMLVHTPERGGGQQLAERGEVVMGQRSLHAGTATRL